jgi:GT2 family glycosyltransferase
LKILAVIVRYNVPLAESQTLLGLNDVFQRWPDLSEDMGVLVWDNSPEPLIDPALPLSFEYRHSSRNEGVSGAYNQALSMARERGAQWMLLLDQDTSVTESYLRAMTAHSHHLATQTHIAAIVPVVRVGDLIVSPRQAFFNRHRPYAGLSGIASGEGFAINSGCLIRVDALQGIGGFSSEFWLDYSDMYVFHQFFLHGLKIFRATDAELQHQMTMLDYDNLMAPWRYKNFIEAEGAFNDLYKSGLENAVQTLRLVVRALRQRMRYKNPQFSRTTVKHLIHRLTMRRTSRLRGWTEAQRKRREGSSAVL